MVDEAGLIYSTFIIHMSQDRSFTFILKTPPASVLLKQAAGIETGSGSPNKTKVGSVTMAKIKVWLLHLC